MRQIWKTRKILTVGNYRIEFNALMENEYDRDPMCDCIGKLMVDAGQYRVIIRDTRKSDVTNELFADVAKDEGNQMYLTIKRMTSDEEILAFIDAYNTNDDEDSWDSDWEEDFRSATAGDYSPSCPWNAPGMSVSDFIR